MQDKKNFLMFVKPLYLWKGIEYLIQALGWGMMSMVILGVFFISEETKAKIPDLFGYMLPPGILVLMIIHLAKNWRRFK